MVERLFPVTFPERPEIQAVAVRLKDGRIVVRTHDEVVALEKAEQQKEFPR